MPTLTPSTKVLYSGLCNILRRMIVVPASLDVWHPRSLRKMELADDTVGSPISMELFQPWEHDASRLPSGSSRGILLHIPSPWCPGLGPGSL